MQCHILTSKTVIWIKTTPGKYYFSFSFIYAMLVELLKGRSHSKKDTIFIIPAKKKYYKMAKIPNSLTTVKTHD